MEDKKTILLASAPVGKAIFTMALPVIAGMMVQVLYNLVDVYFIGQLQNAAALAAANLTMPIFMMQMAIASIVGNGAASYISRSMGEKDYKTANHTLSTSVLICVLLGGIFTAVGCGFSLQIVTALGAGENTFAYANDYSVILFAGSIPIMLAFAMGQLLRSEGGAMGAMVGMMIGTVSNIALDPIFIFNLGMGVKGAAIATVLGNVFALVYYIIYYARGKSIIKFSIKLISKQKRIWKEIFSIGVPSAVSQFLVSVALIVCNNLVAAYGDSHVAAYGVAMKLMTIGTFVFMGFSAGCQPIIGYNYGARNISRASKVIKTGMLSSVIIGGALMAVFGAFAPQMIGIFTSLTEVVSSGTEFLRAMMFSLPTIGVIMLSMITVQAIGRAKPALFLSLARQGVVYIPLLFLMNSLFGLGGLMYAQPISDALMVVVSVAILVKVLKNAKIKMQDAVSDKTKPSCELPLE